MKPFFFFLLSSCFLFANNLKISGNTIIDFDTNLIWQDHSDNTSFRFSQEKAIEYCQKLSQSGSSSWRLPTVEEYKSIIDKSRTDEIMINKKFRHILPQGYWTQDKTWRTLNRYGYYIYFKSGTAYYENKTYPKYVRCVRNK
jgi:hypothetical protein